MSPFTILGRDEVSITRVNTKAPSAIESERLILGVSMVNPQQLSIAAELVRENDFFVGKHRQIWQAINEMFLTGSEVDTITVLNRLKKNGVSEKDFGGASYLSSLTSSHGYGQIEDHCKIVAEKHMMRQLYDLSIETSQKSYDDTEDAFDLVWDTQKRLDLIVDRRASTIMDAATVVKITMREIEEVMKSDRHLVGIDTGLERLNKLTTGWKEGTLNIIAARPSMGKTAFALKTARTSAAEGSGVAFFSLEMSASELMHRMLSSDARVDHYLTQTGQLTDPDLDRLGIAGGFISEFPFYIDDQSTSLLQIIAKARQLKNRFDIKMIVVDYLQLLEGKARTSAERAMELGLYTRALKLLAKDLGIVVIALSQLSRKVEGRQKPRPEMADLRESGRIEEDSDTITMIWRPERYGHNFDMIALPSGQEVSSKGLAEFVLTKQRNGPIGTFIATFIDKFVTFEDYYYEKDTTPKIGAPSSPF